MGVFEWNQPPSNQNDTRKTEWRIARPAKVSAIITGLMWSFMIAVELATANPHVPPPLTMNGLVAMIAATFAFGFGYAMLLENGEKL